MKKIFSLFASLIVLLIFLTGCMTNNASKTSKSEDKQITKSNKKDGPKFKKIGDTAQVDDVSYKLISVEKTDERNEFEDSTPKNVIKVVYHVTNQTDDDLSVGLGLEVYGPKNNKLESYPIDGSTFDSIASGKEITVTAGFAADTLGEFELHFRPFLSDKESVKFKVNLE